ncbi:MAG TPA: RNA polymerase factor sigma-54 [Candidatus Eisenbacteria bacterium]
MEMRQGLRLTQTQKLVMTPKLQQALKLLQAPTLELQQMLKAEMVSNPLLEEIDEITEEPEPEKATAEDDFGEEGRLEREEQEPLEAPEAPEEVDWTEFMQQGSDASTTRSEERHEEFVERVPISRPSLDEHLAEQLRYKGMGDEAEAIGDYLIGSIDERGYLTMTVEEVAAELDKPVETIESVLKAIQALDPPGIGARDLRECLLLQLRARGQEGELSWRIVDKHFDDLVRRRQIDIARSLKVPVEEVQTALDLIGTLSPVPGNQVSGADAQYVYPDLIVERVGEDYVFTLNDRKVPRLRICSAYEHVLKDGAPKNGETRDYVVSKLNSARWLIQTIEQRRKTMVKVMRAIVEEQREFFDSGILHLKPLTLQDIASKIGMHESTVSRVTSGKYVQTPRGVFELKYFFSSGLNTQGGDDISAKSAKAIIAKLIEGEDKHDPLSDQKLMEMLQSQGLDIARRTVAKYREQLNVPNARFRKRH